MFYYRVNLEHACRIFNFLPLHNPPNMYHFKNVKCRCLRLNYKFNLKFVHYNEKPFFDHVKSYIQSKCF